MSFMKNISLYFSSLDETNKSLPLVLKKEIIGATSDDINADLEE